jgi:hypothetical protein
MPEFLPRENKPYFLATTFWILGLIVTYFILPAPTPEEIASHGAVGVGITLVGAVAIEWRQNWRVLLRPDTLAFSVLYFLTFFEFLLPQGAVNDMTTRTSMYYACWLCLMAFGAMAVGRHFAPPMPRALTRIVQQPTPSAALLWVFGISLLFGTLYMLLAVNFNVFAMIDQMMGPRFTQSWGRGKYGDWKALLNQVGEVIQLVPPLGGLILARRERYGFLTVALVTLGVVFCIFQAFAGSTRNLLATYLITFLIAYGVNTARNRYPEFLVLCGLAAIGFFLASPIMLTTRTIGLKEYFINGARSGRVNEQPSTFFVDLNLVNIGELTKTFPDNYRFLGLEVPYIALVGPVPRALWPGKPQGLSLSLEDALDVSNGMTVSTTYIGEAYIAGGSWGVVLAGLFFGMLASWWGKLVSLVRSEFGFLIYASGFLAMAISMRSLFALTTAALPTAASIILALVFTRRTTVPSDLTSDISSPAKET